ncbi:MAG: nicotinate-nucleotide adenylyltransferase [Clostridiales bacterium]|nr:nicotinate-nucleotide adenylyltransferase [Clostridiales bacterium]
MARIGIMGGTFDPIHVGHLSVAEQARSEYELDEIWFMPSGTPPHKKDHPITDAKDRCAMVQLAIAPYPSFRFSDFEVRRPGNTYTAQTLKLLCEAYPQHEFFFIIGEDSFYELQTWYHPEEIMNRVTLLVAGRAYRKPHISPENQLHFLKERFHADIRFLHFEEIDISSQDLRRMEGNGRNTIRYIPESVENYIMEHGLYRNAVRTGANT